MSRQETASSDSVARQLSQLRAGAGCPAWEVAAAARMDSTLLNKIEHGRRLPTEAQLAAFAKFFGIAIIPLRERWLAEKMMQKFGRHPECAAAARIINETAGEYRGKKRSISGSKPPSAGDNRKKAK